MHIPARLSPRPHYPSQHHHRSRIPRHPIPLLDPTEPTPPAASHGSGVADPRYSPSPAHTAEGPEPGATTLQLHQTKYTNSEHNPLIRPIARRTLSPWTLLPPPRRPPPTPSTPSSPPRSPPSRATSPPPPPNWPTGSAPPNSPTNSPPSSPTLNPSNTSAPWPHAPRPSPPAAHSSPPTTPSSNAASPPPSSAPPSTPHAAPRKREARACGRTPNLHHNPDPPAHHRLPPAPPRIPTPRPHTTSSRSCLSS